jgi:hypothetical protein
LTDLEKNQILKPVSAELDRQKEKAAKFKKERNTAREALTLVREKLQGLATERMSPRMLAVVMESLKAIGDAEKEIN